MSTIAIIPIPGIPQIQPGDDLPSLLLDAIDQYAIGELVVETDQPLDPVSLMHWVGIIPDHVFMPLIIDRQMVVTGDAFVRAARNITARAE